MEDEQEYEKEIDVEVDKIDLMVPLSLGRQGNHGPRFVRGR